MMNKGQIANILSMHEERLAETVRISLSEIAQLDINTTLEWAKRLIESRENVSEVIIG